MQNNPPIISVVMSVFNGEKFLKESIDGILNQTFSDFELIIVDDGSTDSTKSIVLGYKDDRIRLFSNSNNFGTPKALNFGMSHARGEFIARHDADDISCPERFKSQVEFLRNNPDIILVGSDAYVIDNDGTILEKKQLPNNPLKYLQKHNVFFHGSIMFRKKIVDEVGMYNEILRNAQDYEFLVRISKYNKNLVNLNIPLYMWRIQKYPSYKATKTRVLYSILARKIINECTNPEMVRKIQSDGIDAIYPYLTISEYLFYYRRVLYEYLFRSDPKSIMKKTKLWNRKK